MKTVRLFEYYFLRRTCIRCMPAHRYGSGNNILLFPWSEGLKTQTYCLGDGREKCIRVGFINLNRELRLSENKDYLRAELFKIIPGTSANQTSEVSKISEVYG